MHLGRTGRAPTSTSSTRRATPISAARSSASCHGRRRAAAGRRRRRPDAADQVRHRKALALGLKPIVVVNKIDRPDARPAEVLDEVFDLFLNLDASDEQLDFPTSTPRPRRLWLTDDVRSGDLTPLFDHRQPRPAPDASTPARSDARHLARPRPVPRPHPHRPHRERPARQVNMPIKALDVDGKLVEKAAITKVFAFRGLERVPVEPRRATSSPSPASPRRPSPTPSPTRRSTAPLHAQPIDPPTLAMSFSSTTAPIAGATATR
jgi:GTP-binding protein